MFSIPTITKNLMIINVLMFAATWVFSSLGIDLSSLGGLHFFLAQDFQVYQLITYQFLHSGFTHLFFNMFALWMFGRIIESVWGPRKFLFYYLSCGVGAGLMQEIAQFGSFYLTVTAQDPTLSLGGVFAIGQQLSAQLNAWTTIGASGAVYAVLLAFGMLFPNERMFIFPIPIPIKAKWFITFYVVLELFFALGSPGDGVAHTAHLGGMLFGFLMIRYWRQQSPWQNNGSSSASEFFSQMKRFFDMHKRERSSGMKVERGGGRRETDWEYNARKKANQEEIDRILDKIRRTGYDSLTKEEKKKLFDSSNND